MHSEAHAGFAVEASRIGLPTGRYLDLGGYDVNGTVHDLVRRTVVDADVHITVLDYREGPGVDIVADARTFMTDVKYDAVISTELLEHVAPLPDLPDIDGWRLVIGAASDALRPGGVFVGTCASTGRGAHAADGSGWAANGEHYANVDPADLDDCLRDFGFVDVTVTYNPHPGDVYWSARRPEPGEVAAC